MARTLSDPVVGRCIYGNMPRFKLANRYQLLINGLELLQIDLTYKIHGRAQAQDSAVSRTFPDGVPLGAFLCRLLCTVQNWA